MNLKEALINKVIYKIILIIYELFTKNVKFFIFFFFHKIKK